MNSIKSKGYDIHFNDKAYEALNQYLATQKFSNLFVLVDENTHDHCLPKFLSRLETNLVIEIIEIEAGESHKTIDTCVGVWNALSELNADRKCLILNLGGGVVTDLGGFVACTFKRGVQYINIPTSLLAMVDASVGGKTGVDLGHLKNQVGVISSGAMVLIDSSFLKTLPENQLMSGLAEMLKHGLIRNKVYFEKLISLEVYTPETLDELIYDSVIIKKDIVTEDPLEHGIRKHLNFGHTLGHAIESHFLGQLEKGELLHGEAIVIGMILECFISSEILGLAKNELEDITDKLLNIYPKIPIAQTDFEPIIELLKHDKKNENGNINFVLLEKVGQPKINCLVDNELIVKSFNYYNYKLSELS